MAPFQKEISRINTLGYTTYRLRKEKIFGERVVQQFRDGELASWSVMEKLCSLLNCQVGDIVEYYQASGQ